MVNRIRIIFPHGLNKDFDSKFYVGSQVQHETSEEGQISLGQNIVNITIKTKTIVWIG